VRLPREFEEFVKTFPEQRFFVTTMDGAIGRIYPIQVWMENEKILAQETEDPQAAEDLAFLAHYWGSESSIDAQARILVPPGLRRKLEIEDQKVNLRFYNGGIDLFSEAASTARLERATAAAPASLTKFRQKGLK
jgi:MraZ protein